MTTSASASSSAAYHLVSTFSPPTSPTPSSIPLTTLPSSLPLTLLPSSTTATHHHPHPHSHHPPSHSHPPLTTSSSIRIHSPHPLINKPTYLEHSNLRFFILDTPTPTNLPSYLSLFQRKHVTAIARACEATYDSRTLTEHGIRVLDVPFQDGAAPSEEVIRRWMELVTEVFGPPVPVKAGGAGAGGARGGGGKKGGGGGQGVGEEEKRAAEEVGGVVVSSFSVSSTAGPALPLSPSAHVVPSSPRASHSHAQHHSHGPAIGVHCVAGLGRAPVLVCIALMHSGMAAHDAVSLVRKKRRGAINAKQLQFLEAYRPHTHTPCCTVQ